MSAPILLAGCVGSTILAAGSSALVMYFSDSGDDVDDPKSTITKPTPKKEVFYIEGSEGNPYTLDKAAAKAACTAVGATLATDAQLTADHTAGADWCSTGWIADGEPSFPITTTLLPGCATSPQVSRWTPGGGLAGANCYGVKPQKDSNPRVRPFNESKWSRYS